MAYSEEETAFIRNTYLKNPSKTTIDEIALAINKNRNQIIGKLSKEGLYERQRYVTKTGEAPVTKLELVERITSLTEIPRFKLEGLDKAPKLALKALIQVLAKSELDCDEDSDPV